MALIVLGAPRIRRRAGSIRAIQCVRSPEALPFEVLNREGFEPPTSPVRERSVRWSYRPILATHGGIEPPHLSLSHSAVELHFGLTVPLGHTRCSATELMSHMVRQEGLEP